MASRTQADIVDDPVNDQKRGFLPWEDDLEMISKYTDRKVGFNGKFNSSSSCNNAPFSYYASSSLVQSPASVVLVALNDCALPLCLII